MEDVDVHKLPRKELLQLCTDHNIRTAGVKHDDLVRLLEKKLHPPAADPPRVTPKARSQISPFSSPRARVKSAENTSAPTPGSTSQGRSLRPLVLVDDLSRKNSPEPSPRTPRKDQLSPNPGVLPRKPIVTKTTSAPAAQRSDLLRKKVNNLTAIGKLQTQERTRPAQHSDGSSVRGRNNAVAAPMSGIGKQAQERRPLQQSDHGSSVRNRSSTAVGAPKKNIRSTSMVPVKRPGERTLGIQSKEASRKGQTNPNAASSPRASEGEASVTAIAGSHSDLGSQSFGSVSEIATDAGHYAMWEDSDADDAHSVSSEPASRFTSQIERFHSPRKSTGSKLGRVASPLLDSAHGRRSSLDSSVESNAPHGKDSDLSAAQGEENLISTCFQEDDTAFNLVGDAHGLEINSFLDAHFANAEVNAAEGSHQVEQFEQVRTPEISTAGFQENDIMANSEQSMREQDGGTSDNDVSKAAPSTMQKDILSDVDHDESSNSGNPTVEHDVLASKENAEGEKWFDSTLNLIHEEGSPEEGANSQAGMGMNIQLLSERSATSSPSHQESPYNSGAQLPGKNDPSTNDICCSGKDYPVTSTAESVERVHFNTDSAPLPHPDMERSSVTPRSVNRSDSSPTPDNTAELDTAGELDLCAAKSTSPCDELQQDFDIKLRPKHDYSKDGIKRSNLLQDRTENIPLLQDGRENDNTQLIRRTFPSSILLWCSQLFSAIFGTRSQS